MTHVELTTEIPGDVLIVDDHPPTAGLLVDLLASAFPGFTTRIATSAAEAMSLCHALRPRVVIMDIGLPDVNGIETTRRIKALSSDVAVVMHTNFDHSVYEQESVMAGADAFVSKTQTYAELIPAITRLLHPIQVKP